MALVLCPGHFIDPSDVKPEELQINYERIPI